MSKEWRPFIPSAARDLLPPVRVTGKADDQSRFLVASRNDMYRSEDGRYTG